MRTVFAAYLIFRIFNEDSIVNKMYAARPMVTISMILVRILIISRVKLLKKRFAYKELIPINSI